MQIDKIYKIIMEFYRELSGRSDRNESFNVF